MSLAISFIQQSLNGRSVQRAIERPNGDYQLNWLQHIKITLVDTKGHVEEYSVEHTQDRKFD